MMKISHILTVLLLACLCLPVNASESRTVVTSFSILADMVKQVGGDKVKVETLVAPDSDTHMFQPSPADAVRLARADLVIVNGLGFEGWIDRLIKSSRYRGKIIVASAGITPLVHDGYHDDGHGHDGQADPHAWLDIHNAIIYVDNITAALTGLDQQNRPLYNQNAESYKAQMQKLDAWIKTSFKSIAVEKRNVVTSHSAFGYFGHAYGLNFISPVGINTEAEASAKKLADIITQIKKENIRALFFENISNTRLLEQLSHESGARIGGKLYADALSGPQGPAATYLDLMRHNASTILNALQD